MVDRHVLDKDVMLRIMSSANILRKDDVRDLLLSLGREGGDYEGAQMEWCSLFLTLTLPRRPVTYAVEQPITSIHRRRLVLMEQPMP